MPPCRAIYGTGTCIHNPSPLTSICIDENGDEPVGLGQGVDVAGDALRRLLVLGVARRPREVAQLQLDRRHLRRRTVRAPLRRVPARVSAAVILIN